MKSLVKQLKLTLLQNRRHNRYIFLNYYFWKCWLINRQFMTKILNVKVIKKQFAALLITFYFEGFCTFEHLWHFNEIVNCSVLKKLISTAAGLNQSLSLFIDWWSFSCTVNTHAPWCRSKWPTPPGQCICRCRSRTHQRSGWCSAPWEWGGRAGGRALCGSGIWWSAHIKNKQKKVRTSNKKMQRNVGHTEVWDQRLRRSHCYIPVDWVLVELTELPVDGEDVHVVVLLEVVGQQVQRVLASLQPLLVLVDFLHLKVQTDGVHVIKTLAFPKACWISLG